MNLEPFVTRVQAAVLEYAAKFPLGGTAPAEQKNFAIHILKNPTYEEVSMTALVATDATVLASVSLDGTVPNVDAVTDDSIRAVVAARWALVAQKYPTPAPVATGA